MTAPTTGASTMNRIHASVAEGSRRRARRTPPMTTPCTTTATSSTMAVMRIGSMANGMLQRFYARAELS